MSLLASEALARAAGYQDGQHVHSPGGPVAMSLAFIRRQGRRVLRCRRYPTAYDALEPSIDAETMHLHHDKHHAAYVKGANDALAKLAEIREGKIDPSALSDLTEKLTFNLSGHLLHSVFWAVMGTGETSPRASSRPTSRSTSVRTHSSKPSFRPWQPRFREMAGAFLPTSPFRSGSSCSRRGTTS